MKAITTIFTVVTLTAAVIGCEGGYYDEDTQMLVKVGQETEAASELSPPDDVVPCGDMLGGAIKSDIERRNGYAFKVEVAAAQAKSRVSEALDAIEPAFRSKVEAEKLRDISTCEARKVDINSYPGDWGEHACRAQVIDHGGTRWRGQEVKIKSYSNITIEDCVVAGNSVLWCQRNNLEKLVVTAFGGLNTSYSVVCSASRSGKAPNTEKDTPRHDDVSRVVN
jgi:hypothetical protein